MVERKDLDKLVELRAAHADVKKRLSDKMKVFADENQALMDTEKRLKAGLLGVEMAIKEMAVSEFKEKGIKKMLGGVGIRESAGLEYDDSKALEFAKEKDMFLVLDVKGFEAAAVSMKLDFVSVVKKISATLPKVVKYE